MSLHIERVSPRFERYLHGSISMWQITTVRYLQVQEEGKKAVDGRRATVRQTVGRTRAEFQVVFANCMRVLMSRITALERRVPLNARWMRPLNLNPRSDIAFFFGVQTG